MSIVYVLLSLTKSTDWLLDWKFKCECLPDAYCGWIGGDYSGN